jgi:hypothetical protein
VTPHDPERLRVVGASDLEQRLLSAAAAEEPSPELTRRMARGLGIAAGAGVTAASAGSAAASATGSGLLWPMISAGMAAVAVAGAVIGWSGTHHRVPAAPAAQTAPAQPPVAAPPAAAVALPAPRPHRHHATPAPAAGDLQAEIALLDAARAAASGGDDARALALLRRYDASFPAGTFRPESAALQIEALAHLGQIARARALGRAFLAAHPDSPLVGRVKRAIPSDP